MKLVRALFADLGLLTLAVVFGWAIWYVVREELTESQRREVQVVVESGSDLLDVAATRNTVVIEVHGSRGAVDAFRAMHSPKIVRRVTTSDLPQGVDETRREFGKDDFDFGDMLGAALTVVEMEPSLVGVQLFRVAVQEKTVAPPEFQGAADLSLRHVLQSYTNTAKVRGKVSVLSTFREIRTLVAKEKLQGFAESLRDTPKTTARLDLEVDPSQRDLFTLVDPPRLSARVELSRVAEQELVLPILVLGETSTAKAGAPARHVQFAELNKPCFVRGDPPKVKLQFTGVPSALAALATGKARAFVLATDLPADQRNGDVPVHVADLPAGVALAQECSVYVEETR